MREFIIRDLNGFWITFAEPSVFELLMRSVREDNIEAVRAILQRSGTKPETLTEVLAAASSVEISGDSHAGIVEMLKQAGAVSPTEVDVEILQSYVGRYRGEEGIEFNVN
jgi:hypothetical protein